MEILILLAAIAGLAFLALRHHRAGAPKRTRARENTGWDDADHGGDAGGDGGGD